jgi:hypothetical protein
MRLFISSICIDIIIEKKNTSNRPNFCPREVGEIEREEGGGVGGRVAALCRPSEDK